ERRVFNFSKNGYEELSKEIIDSSGINVYKIEMKKLPEEVVAVNYNNLPKGDIEFCYVLDGKLLKGYFSIHYQLITERNVVPMRQFISYDSDPLIKSFQVKAIAKNLTWAQPNHASNYEIDFYITQEFNGANANGFRVEAKDYKL